MVSEVIYDEAICTVEDHEEKIPMLIYVSREKKSNHPHHFKAGALNVLIGFLYDSVVEDFVTGFRLHCRGWKSNTRERERWKKRFSKRKMTSTIIRSISAPVTFPAPPATAATAPFFFPSSDIVSLPTAATTPVRTARNDVPTCPKNQTPCTLLLQHTSRAGRIQQPTSRARNKKE